MRRCSRFVRFVGRAALLVTSAAAAERPAFGQPADDAAGETSVEPPPTLREREKFTGDWLGLRPKVENRGITVNFSSTQYYQGTAAGGVEREFQYGGRHDCFLNLDGAQLGLWDGFTVDLHAERRYGEVVNSIGGTLMAPNLMMAFPTSDGSVAALTGVTFTQQLSEAWQVYFGKLNTLDGFEQPLTGADNFSGFQNTAMLYNPVFARTVPYATLGAGISYLRDEESVFSLIVYDTNDATTTSGFETFFTNGATIYGEWNAVTQFFNRPCNHGLSGTYSTGTYTSLSPPTKYLDPIQGLVVTPAAKTGSWCLAYNVDQALHVSPDDPERTWGVFGNFGIADDNPSPAHWFASGGISGTSGLGGRTKDTFGIAYFYLGVSDSLKNLAPRILQFRDETGIELYYNAAVTPWCQITPDLQVIQPFQARVDTTVIVGLRAHVVF